MKKEIRIGYDYFNQASELNPLEKELFIKAKEAREKAYAPYSEFLVGCAILLEDGTIVEGNNQENAAYPSGLCAERTTLFWTAANHPKKKITKLFIVGAPKTKSHKETPPVPPCGACRQSIVEYETKQKQNIEIYFGTLNGEVYRLDSIASLLPFNFNDDYLK